MKSLKIQGFTFIELIIVVSIMVIIWSISIWSFMKNVVTQDLKNNIYSSINVLKDIESDLWKNITDYEIKFYENKNYVEYNLNTLNNTVSFSGSYNEVNNILTWSLVWTWTNVVINVYHNNKVINKLTSLSALNSYKLTDFTWDYKFAFQVDSNAINTLWMVFFPTLDDEKTILTNSGFVLKSYLWQKDNTEITLDFDTLWEKTTIKYK